MVTWEPWDPGTNANSLKTPSIQPQFRLARIIDGSFDPYIRRFARRAAALRGPLMLRLMHEMNGRWYPWGGTVNGNKPEEFVQAWRHVHDIFVHEGATNVTWVWSPNHESRPNTIENRYSVYYPGDAYVDWVAATGFNFGSTTPTSKWVSFEGNFAAPLAYLRTLGKPVMISEFGSVEQGGNKAAWMADALSRIRNDHPEIKAFVYFDSNEKGSVQSQDWRINSSPSSLTAFQKGIADPYFVGAPANTLSAWTNSLSNTDWSYLRSIQPLY
jgi:beta-mannanase